MAQILDLQRTFRFGGRDLPDPNPSLTPEEVLKHYGGQFPRLIGAKVIEPVIVGDRSMNSSKQTSGIEASNPLDLLRDWAAGGTPQPKENTEPSLQTEQKVRLWNLLTSPSKPGTISDSHAPR